MALKEKRKLSERNKSLVFAGALVLVAGAAYLVVAPPDGGQATAPGGPPAGAARGDGSGRPGGGGPPRILPVKATAAKIGDLDVVVSALGTVTAFNTATVKARVDGPIVNIRFREGQLVKAGDVLVDIDPRPFQIQLDQMHGQVQKDEAQLAAAQVDVERYRALLAQDSIARQQVDAQEALVRQLKGTVDTDRALEANARLNLSFTRVTAPAPGRIGLRQVDIGNIVRSSDATGIAVITQTQPINLVFAIPAERLGNIVQRLQKGDKLLVEAWDRSGSTLLAEGRLRSVDNQIDVSTGTVKLKAEFANRDDSLFPNQFVNARLKVETRRDNVLLQSAAIQRNAQGSYVYVINGERAVEPRPVRVGPGDGSVVTIEAGLAAGEQVVLDGADRLQAGSKVEVLSVDGKSAKADAGGGSAPPGRRQRGDGQGRAPGADAARQPAGAGSR